MTGGISCPPREDADSIAAAVVHEPTQGHNKTPL
jgi:hypothetical protein